MNNIRDTLDPAWAQLAALRAISEKPKDSDGTLVTESYIMDHCFESIPAFHDLSAEDRDYVFDLVFDAVEHLVDEEILQVVDATFEVNPKHSELLERRKV